MTLVPTAYAGAFVGYCPHGERAPSPTQDSAGPSTSTAGHALHGRTRVRASSRKQPLSSSGPESECFIAWNGRSPFSCGGACACLASWPSNAGGGLVLDHEQLVGATGTFSFPSCSGERLVPPKRTPLMSSSPGLSLHWRRRTCSSSPRRSHPSLKSCSMSSRTSPCRGRFPPLCTCASRVPAPVRELGVGCSPHV